MNLDLITGDVGSTTTQHNQLFFTGAWMKREGRSTAGGSCCQTETYVPLQSGLMTTLNVNIESSSCHLFPSWVQVVFADLFDKI